MVSALYVLMSPSVLWEYFLPYFLLKVLKFCHILYILSLSQMKWFLCMVWGERSSFILFSWGKIISLSTVCWVAPSLPNDLQSSITFPISMFITVCFGLFILFWKNMLENKVFCYKFVLNFIKFFSACKVDIIWLFSKDLLMVKVIYRFSIKPPLNS